MIMTIPDLYYLGDRGKRRKEPRSPAKLIQFVARRCLARCRRVAAQLAKRAARHGCCRNVRQSVCCPIVCFSHLGLSVPNQVLTHGARGHARRSRRALLCQTLSASTKSHASEKNKNSDFDILSIASDVFFDADSKSPHMT